MRTIRTLAVELGLACSLATPAAAQRPHYAEHVWATPTLESGVADAAGPGLLGRGDRDHRYTGFYIGLGLGAASTLFSVAWCSDRDNDCSTTRALVLGPVMTGVLGLTGALIGSLFPKQPDSSARGE